MVEKSSLGTLLLAAGGVLYLLGLILMLDRLCLVLGNFCFLVGTAYVTGTYALIAFFLKPSKLKGTACYFIGLFLLLVGWVTLATGLQLYGVFVLFRDFLPQIENKVPVIRSVLRTIKNWRGDDRKSTLPF